VDVLGQRLAALVPRLAHAAGIPHFSPRIGSGVLHVSRHYREALTVTALARAARTSPSHLAHRFHAEIGTAPHRYVARLRLGVARHLLRTTNQSLERVAEATGFCDAPHLARSFRARYGVAPGEFRRSTRDG